MKKIAIILSAMLLGTTLFAGCNNSTVSKKETDTDEKELVLPDVTKEDAYKEAYLELVNELNARYEDTEWTYDLVDINGDKTPELVANYPVTVSLYTVSDGNVYTIMEEQVYGFAGNNGYYYKPGENVIFNENYEYAGLLVYENYCKINEANSLENYHDKPLFTTTWNDINEDGAIDDNEIGDTTYYYFGNDKITEKEYNELRFGDSFEMLYGEMTFDEIIAELSK